MAKDKKQKKNDCSKISTFGGSGPRIECMKKQGLLGKMGAPKKEEKEYSDEQYRKTAKTPDNVKSTEASKKKSAEAVAKRRAEVAKSIAAAKKKAKAKASGSGKS